MGFTRSRTLLLVAWLVLSALALRGASHVERVLDYVFAPARVIGELALPFRLASHSSSAAAARASEASSSVDVERARALLVDAQNAALPRDPMLVSGRSLCVARVVGRVRDRADALVVRAPQGVALEPGMGVVFGDAYVGRVESLDAARNDEAIVALVTGREFRVRARVEPDALEVAAAETNAPSAAHSGASVTLVVGGLAATSNDAWRALHLATHVPSDPRVTHGSVLVDEPRSEPNAAFVAGFGLGELVAYESQGVKTLAVRAALDYADGLSWVALVAAPEHAMAGDVLAEDPFNSASWRIGRVLVTGDASCGTSARTLDLAHDDASERARVGAAVSLGAFFVGRVLTVGPFRVDIALLGDPRLAFDAIARVEGLAAPLALGRLRALRPCRDGAIEFEWNPRVILPASVSATTAEIFTAAGERDVPAGLHVGRCAIPSGSGRHVLRVETSARGLASALHLRVWIGRRGDVGEAP